MKRVTEATRHPLHLAVPVTHVRNQVCYVSNYSIDYNGNKVYC